MTGIPRSTVNEIINGKRPISAESVIPLGTLRGMNPQFWANLPTRHDLRRVELERALAIRTRVQPLAS